MTYYNQANYQQQPYSKQPKIYYGKRPRSGGPGGFNKKFVVDSNESALTAANIIFLTAPTPSPNALVKNIISPACSIIVRCNSASFNLRIGLISNDVANQALDGSMAKIEFAVPKENIGFLKYYALDATAEGGAEGGNHNGAEKKDTAAKEEGENGAKEENGAKDAKNTKGYTGRLIIGLKQCLTKSLEANKLIDNDQFLACRLFVVEFKGHPANKKINPSIVFGNSFKNGPCKGLDDIRSWEGADKATLERAVEYHVQISRKEEAFISEKTECEQCGICLQRRLLELHKTTVCSKRPVECPHCKQNLCYVQLSEHKKTECPEIVRPCPNGCGASLKLDELPEHSPACPRKPEPCPFGGYGCEQTASRDTMEAHEKEAAHRHLALLLERVAGLEEAVKALKGGE